MPHSVSSPAAKRAPLVIALLCVWILWGSTYFAIRVGLEALPPFLLAGSRFVVAGTLLALFARWRGAAWPHREHFVPALIAGALLMLTSNGLVCWAETRVDSSIAALVVSGVPLWMMLLDWRFTGGARPGWPSAIGILVGIVGVGILAAPVPGHTVDPLGIAALVAATISWSAGSLYSRRANLPPSQRMSTALQMLLGGALQLVAGFALGEGSRCDLGLLETRHVLSWVWLVCAGSLAGFSAYLWLLRNTRPTVATSYAFVNPLVAITLGTWLGGEVLPPRAWIATPLIVGAVTLVVLRRRTPPVPRA